MKYLIVVLVACLAGAFAELSEEQIAKMKQYKAECLVETGMEESVLDDIKAGKDFEVSEKLNCFAACLLSKSAMLKPDGTFDEATAREKMLSHLPAEKVDEVLGKCKDLAGKDMCETGGKVMFCFHEMQAIPIIN